MSKPYRRKHYLINKPLQLRYMAYVIIALVAISAISLVSLYIGIWGGILESFSNEKIRNEMLIASRLTQYDEARVPTDKSFSTLSLFKQSEKLSQRQREVFKKILHQTNKDLLLRLLMLLVLIAWGSIYISHKIAGPLYRFHVTLDEIARGNLATRVHLRRFDEAQFLGKQFNEAIIAMDTNYSTLKNILKEHKQDPEKLITKLNQELSKIHTSVDK